MAVRRSFTPLRGAHKLLLQRMCSLSSFIDRRNGCTKYCDGDKFCCYPWLVCHDINSAMHCSLKLAPTMINHLTSNKKTGGKIAKAEHSYEFTKITIRLRCHLLCTRPTGHAYRRLALFPCRLSPQKTGGGCLGTKLIACMPSAADEAWYWPKCVLRSG